MPTRIAVVQAPPSLLDRHGTIERVVDAIEEASGQGAALIDFPEAHISAKPRPRSGPPPRSGSGSLASQTRWRGMPWIRAEVGLDAQNEQLRRFATILVDTIF